MSSQRLLLSGLLAAALSLFFVDLGGSSIWDANEAYYVETPREMLESGDYLNPSFNYEPRFNKPVLSYWIVAALYHVFGVSVTIERRCSPPRDSQQTRDSSCLPGGFSSTSRSPHS